MFKSIVTKLWLTIFALILVILLVFSLFLANRLETIYFRHQVKLMNETAMQWKEIILSKHSSSKIQREMVFWRNVSKYDIAVFNQKGIVVFSSDPGHISIGKESNWEHIEAGIENRETYYTGYNPDLQMEMTATFLPFVDDQGQKYLIMVHAPTHDLLEMIDATRTVSFWILIFCFILSGALVWYLSNLIAKPIIDIRMIALGMAKGDFSVLATVNRSDELGDLAKTMNILSTRLNKTLKSLTRANSDLTTLLQRWKEFVADASHELRTPLFLIQGYSEALLDKIVKNEEQKTEYLTVINKESLRVQKLVNDLLAVEGGLPLNKQPTDLRELVLETIAPFDIVARDKHIAIEVDKNLSGIGSINIDPDKIGEVIYNLVDNALRYTPENGRITISGESVGPETVKLKVSDTGTGIDPSHLPHLFERFYRVDKARSRGQGGTGLGLAIVKRIIEQHGGDISVKSKVKKGTSFLITLPK